jgi:hypothetical protein
MGGGVNDFSKIIAQDTHNQSFLNFFLAIMKCIHAHY